MAEGGTPSGETEINRVCGVLGLKKKALRAAMESAGTTTVPTVTEAREWVAQPGKMPAWLRTYIDAAERAKMEAWRAHIAAIRGRPELWKSVPRKSQRPVAVEPTEPRLRAALGLPTPGYKIALQPPKTGALEFPGGQAELEEQERQRVVLRRRPIARRY